MSTIEAAHCNGAADACSGAKCLVLDLRYEATAECPLPRPDKVANSIGSLQISSVAVVSLDKMQWHANVLADSSDA